MKGFKIYHQIMQLKELGFSKSRCAKQLEINRETVTRYWNMTAEEFDRYLYSVRRKQAIDEYQAIIISWIQQFPAVTAAQIQDWLQEQYHQAFNGKGYTLYETASLF
jgi:transposase